MKTATFLMMALAALTGCETVDAGNTGVELSWSRVTGTTYGEGFHVVGMGTDLHPMSVRMQNMDESDISCRSRDNVVVLADVTVSYTLARASAAKVYKQLGDDYANTVIMPATRSTVRDAVASNDALQVAQARGSLEESITSALRSSVRATLHSQRLPTSAIRIDGVQLRNTDLPRSLTDSIESIQRQSNQRLEREQAVRTAQQEAQRLRAEAEGRNSVALLNAQGQAEVRRIDGESQARFNRELSSSLTPGLIELRRIEAQRAISTSPNAHLVVMGSGGPVILQAPGLGGQ